MAGGQAPALSVDQDAQAARVQKHQLAIALHARATAAAGLIQHFSEADLGRANSAILPDEAFTIVAHELNLLVRARALCLPARFLPAFWDHRHAFGIGVIPPPLFARH